MARRRGGNIGHAKRSVDQSNNSRGDASHPKANDNISEQPAAPVPTHQQTNLQTKTEKSANPSPSPKSFEPSTEKQADVIPILSRGTVEKLDPKDSEEATITREHTNSPSLTKLKAPIYKAQDTEFDRDHLAKVDISKRRGNYLLSVGLPKSGKTVLQSYMTYYMDVKGTLNAELDIREADGKINHEAQRIKTIWLESWKRGEFPDSTPVGEDEIRELRLDVKNSENKGQNFNLSFLEISGENFLNVVPNEQNIPKLFERLKMFLTNKRIKLNLAFVLKPNEPHDQASCDALFTNFMTFIKSELNINISKRVGLILILPNTKEIFGKEDWERSRRDRSFYKKLMKSYVYKNFPATYKIYHAWKRSNRAIMSFYIGDVEDRLLKNENFEDVKGFIGLNYRLFTGKKLQPRYSLFKRLLSR
jgi:hypothetical protein